MVGLETVGPEYLNANWPSTLYNGDAQVTQRLNPNVCLKPQTFKDVTTGTNPLHDRLIYSTSVFEDSRHRVREDIGIQVMHWI